MSTFHNDVSALATVATTLQILVVHIFDSLTQVSYSPEHARIIGDRLAMLFPRPHYKISAKSLRYEGCVSGRRDVGFEGALLDVARMATLSAANAARIYVFVWRKVRPQEYVLSPGVSALMRMGGYYLNFLSKNEFCPSDRATFEACTPEHASNSSVWPGRSLAPVHHMLVGLDGTRDDIVSSPAPRAIGPPTPALTPVPEAAKLPLCGAVDGAAGPSNLALPSASTAVCSPFPSPPASAPGSFPSVPAVPAAQAVSKPKAQMALLRQYASAVAADQMQVLAAPKPRKPRARAQKQPVLPPPVWSQRSESPAGPSQPAVQRKRGSFAEQILAASLPEAARRPHGAIPTSIPAVESANQAESGVRAGSQGAASGSQPHATGVTVKRPKKPKKVASRDEPSVDAHGAGAVAAVPRGKGKKRSREEGETATPMHDHPSPKRFARDLPRGESLEASALPLASPQVSEAPVPKSPVAVVEDRSADGNEVQDPEEVVILPRIAKTSILKPATTVAENHSGNGTEGEDLEVVIPPQDGEVSISEVATTAVRDNSNRIDEIVNHSSSTCDDHLFSDGDTKDNEPEDDSKQKVPDDVIDPDADAESFDDFLASAFATEVEAIPIADGSPQSSDFSSSDSDEG